MSKKKLPAKYKELVPKYSYRIEWDDADKIFVVSVEELSGCMTHGKTQKEALDMGHEAVELHLESMYEKNEEIPEPISLQKFRGEFLVRATADLHRKVAQAAARQNQTVNKFVVGLLREKVD